ncbi:S-layer homology domain-containing protein [Paenibacillus sp. PK3_47]|uniref:S-layer homology domain-containing protein n=1 Tax=Paenibacillus sp. PK3_47 TaxID=2072642 RepID=UPI00201D4B7A|nr:S-layer homology domain-containing protein [Paenibacillus sp. PK3_47]
MMKTILSAKSFVLGLALLLVISTLGSAFVPAGQAFAAETALAAADTGATDVSAADAPQITVSEAIEDTVKLILNSGVKSDWEAIGITRAGYQVPGSYLQVLENTVQTEGRLSKVTDYARTVLAITALGGDAANFAGSGSAAGYNLLEKLYNSDKMSSETVNGPVYALLALDSGSYTIPDGAKWTRTALVDEILKQQKDDGGFALFGSAGDPDITAMTLTALAPYQDKPEVKTAGEKAVQWLSSRQDANGGYGGSSESVAQAIIALTSNGIDPTGERFTKNGTDLVGRLMSFFVQGGGFSHTPGAAANSQATEQGLQALVAYNLLGGSGKLYDFPKPAQPEEPSAVNVALSVEGPQGTVAEGKLTALNALDALKQLTAARNIPLDITVYPFGSMVDGINGIKGGTYGGGYWTFLVHRGGEWVYPELGMDSYPLKEADRILIYFGGMNTPVVDSVTISSPQPEPDEKFTVAVTQKHWVTDDVTYATSTVTSPAAGVQVTAGGISVTTNDQGVAVFESGLPAGDYELAVTAYAEGKTPAIVKHKQALKVGVAVHLSVEGPQGTVAEGKLTAINALDALKQLTAARNIPLDITVYPFGSMVDGINGIKGGTYGGGYWTFLVHRGGEWMYPELGMDSYPLKEADRILIYFGGMNTPVVDSVTISSPQPEPGEKFTVAVTQKRWVSDDVTFVTSAVTSPAAGVQVSAGNLSVTTNDQGVAVFESGLPAGTHQLAVTGYVPDSTPSVVRYAQQLVVSSPSVTPVQASATISVIGDSSKGTILPSTNVVLNPGETAYSLLVRQLGSKVVASGSGDGLYVRSIDGLGEFDRGPQSGWMYLVNGTDPKSSAGSYKLQNGDVLTWRYTTNLGTDVGAAPAGNTGSGSGSTASTVSITSGNTLPLQQVGQTTSVTNAGNPMTAAAAAALRQKLAGNQVAMEQEVTPAAASVLKDNGSEVQLQLPAGSVSGTVKIRVQEMKSERSELVSGLYEFTPDGTKFLKEAELSVTIPVTALHPANLALAWLDETSGQWIPVPSVLDVSTGFITGKISHFTKYAVVDRSKFEPEQEKLKSDIAATAKAVTALGEISDWQAVGLARTGNAVPADYLNGVAEQLDASQGEFRKVTDYERLVLAVAAAGGDPRSIGGYNLIEKIYNNKAMVNQGSNGLIFALIALDSGAYNVPADAQWTRERLIKTLLDMQSTSGGFPLTTGGTDDVDITAMAVTALSSHMGQAEVKAAADKAITWLSQQQLENGGFKLAGAESSESTAQVIIALSAAGTGPNDLRFVKAKGGLLSHLASFRQADGSYVHVSGEAVNGLATEQALLALAAYDRFLSGEPKLFSIAPAASGNVIFTDERLISSWALDSVRKAYDTGLMKGVSTDSLVFAPKKNITRAEFAALLLRLTDNSPSSASAAPVFGDVKADAWYYGAVLKAKELGIISGVTGNSFNPDGVITRQDMAVMISRAFKLETGTAAAGAAKFTDDKRISSYARNAVYAVNESGYMTGSGGAFDPSAHVTREMAAVVAVRLP